MTKKRKNSGFTLIELLIVIAIIGVLASVAIPSFTHYIRKSQAVETTESLKKITTGAKLYYYNNQYLPPKSGGYMPKKSHKNICKRFGGKFPDKFVVRDFNKEPWTSLLFTPGKNIRYRYNWIPKKQPALKKRRRIYAKAFIYSLGDLDCDGKYAQRQVILQETSASLGRLTEFGPFIVSGSEFE